MRPRLTTGLPFSLAQHGCVSLRAHIRRLGSWPWSSRERGSCPAPSRGVLLPRNGCSILL
jgi:hypothetical protein